MADSQDITPLILLRHMQGMEERLAAAIDAVEQKLARRIDTAEQQLLALTDRVERGFAFTALQLSTIDERLDDLEVVVIPKIKRKVGMR